MCGGQIEMGAVYFKENFGFYLSAIIPSMPYVHLSARCG
jgi:hypothetical protein